MAKRPLNKSKIGYADPEDSRPLYGWNPGGFGCSGGCEGCWSRALAKRFSKCEQCRRFEVHLHAERLCEPANTRKPGVVLPNYTCDTFDEARPQAHIQAILDAALHAPQHEYAWLTQNHSALRYWASYMEYAAPSWYMGLTIRTQAEADARLPVFLQIPGKLWLSLEPLRGGINLHLATRVWHDSAGRLRCAECCNKDGCDDPTHRYRPECPFCRGTGKALSGGVIVGHDNRRGAPGTETLDHIRSVVEQCIEAGVNVYCKQIHHKGKFLRASHESEFALYPNALKHRSLPWSVPCANSE